jgi:uncharacterized protein (DUF983 family)
MVKVASCTRCGNVTSAHWGSVPECPKCGSDMKEIDVDLEGRERIPRYLNWAGSAFVVTVVILFVATMTDIATVPVWLLLGMVGACILLLFGSLLYQQRLVRESIEKAPQQLGRNRVQRRVRGPGMSRGPIHEQPPRSAQTQRAPRQQRTTEIPKYRARSPETNPQRGSLPIKKPIARGPTTQERPMKATKILQGR